MKVQFEQNELMLRVELNPNGARSRSGKTIVLASSQGNQLIGNWRGLPVYLQLNVLQADHDIATVNRQGKPFANVIQMTKKGQRAVGRRRRAAASGKPAA